MMSEPTPTAKLSSQSTLPPPAPPLPSSRLNPLQRIIAPLGLNRESHAQDDNLRYLNDEAFHHGSPNHDLPSSANKTVPYRAGMPIAALDINAQGTHAVLAGKEILTTIRVQDAKITEDFNLRSSILAHASKPTPLQTETAGHRRDFLPARDVRWSVGIYDHIIATAASIGRISLYDVKAGGLRIELAWLHKHTSQVNKLDFDSFAGYLLLSASQDKTVRLWDIRDPKHVVPKSQFDVRNGVRDVKWSCTDGYDFATCADGGVIQLWDIRRNSHPKLSISAHDKACYSIDWHPDGRHVVSGGFDKYVKVWDFHSDNRRQKPAFSFRAPQAIRNVKWCPASHTTEFAGSSRYQCTQIVTSYTLDDPRIHIWDLRRPLLAFREIDQYQNCVNDILWANKDFLWTVGDEGIFTQHDTSSAPQIQHRVSPCALQWMPDGQCGMFFEDRALSDVSALTDQTFGFLNVPQERLSAGDDGEISRSFSDDEDGGTYPSLTTGSSWRRQSRGTSSRSAKSQTSTPPVGEDRPRVQSLDKTMSQCSEQFQNFQAGAIGLIPGVAEEVDVVKFLATHYAPIATEAERLESPEKILLCLEKSFNQNANVCDRVALHRTAQSWRMLGAVIVPELRDWANRNRAARKEEAIRRKESRRAAQASQNVSKQSSASKPVARGVSGKSEGKQQKGLGGLFKSIIGAERNSNSSDFENSSSMTTPLAKPLPESPYPKRRDFGSPAAVGDTIDNIQPLPPSLLSSHSTAAAASKALAIDPNNGVETPPSSPEQLRQSRRSPARDQPRNQDSPFQKPVKSLSQRSHAAQTQMQEERRAALKDYRAQARPVFTLEEPIGSPAYAKIERDSAESLPMFPASTSSSYQVSSLEESSDSSKSKSKSSEADSSWRGRKSSADVEPGSPLSDESARAQQGLMQRRSEPNRPKNYSVSDDSANFEVDDSAAFSFGYDQSPSLGKAERNQSETRAESDWHTLESSTDLSTGELHTETAVSSSPEMFQFDQNYSPLKTQIYPINPVLKRKKMEVENETPNPADIAQIAELAEVELDVDQYIYADFRPIDLSRYESKLPFAWSAIPLICQSVQFDLESGMAHAQFATHLLMHVSPYFFHQQFRSTKVLDNVSPNNIIERLLKPDSSYRVIEGIFLEHVSFLRQTQLHSAVADLRKMCVELEYPKVVSFAAELKKETTLANRDANQISTMCAHCGHSVQTLQGACERCRKPRHVCPICLSLNGVSSQNSAASVFGDSGTPPVGLWTYCQACGHSAHSFCMEEWLMYAHSDGSCPTTGCLCDCGPGLMRQRRILRQLKSQEESKLIRGTSPATAKKDSLRATPSPAVDKTRAMLRGVRPERVSQSGDERELPSLRSSSSRIESGWQRKSVRLVTPGEESNSRSDDIRGSRNP